MDSPKIHPLISEANSSPQSVALALFFKENAWPKFEINYVFRLEVKGNLHKAEALKFTCDSQLSPFRTMSKA